VKSELARHTIRTSAVLALRLVIQAGNLIAVTRLLGPERFGEFAGIAALAVMLGALSSCGSHLLLLREMSHDPARSDEVLPYALGATLTVGTVLLLVLFACVATLLPSTHASLLVLLSIGLAEVWLQPLLVLTSIDRQAHGGIASSQLLLTLPLALRLVAAWAIWAWTPSHPLEIYALAYIGATVASLLAGLYGLTRSWPRPTRWRLPTRTEWRDTSGFAVLNLTAMGPTELDKTLALRLLPLSAAGLYAASARVVGALVLPVMALMLAALPRLFRDSRQASGNKLLRGIFASSLAYGLLAAALLLVGGSALEWVFGARYTGMSGLLHWLALAVPGMALRIAAGNALMAGSHPWLRAGAEVLGLVALCSAAWLLAPNHHDAGMPLALACSEWSMAVAGWSMLLRRR
jgi:O-antigen/teichoic acid export membrane protein